MHIPMHIKFMFKKINLAYGRPLDFSKCADNGTTAVLFFNYKSLGSSLENSRLPTLISTNLKLAVWGPGKLYLKKKMKPYL